MFNRAFKRSSSSGDIDFEVTSFDEARLALDEVPAGVAAFVSSRAAPLMPVRDEGAQRWASQRKHQPQAADRAVTGATVDWMLALPEALRPHLLSQQYPRLANQLAEGWPEPERALRTIRDLMIDRRGGRRGLPPGVQTELRALQDQLKRMLQPAIDPQALAEARRLLESAGYRVIGPVA